MDTVATDIKQCILPVQELVFSDDGASLSCCALKRIDSIGNSNNLPVETEISAMAKVFKMKGQHSFDVRQ